MNYYRHFALRALKEELKNPLVYLLSFLFSVVAVLLLRNLDGAALAPTAMDFLGMAMILNGLAFFGYIGIFFCAQRVFFREKKAKALTITLCSPASLGEIFWGNVSGVVLGGFVVPALFILAAAAVLAPHGLAELASWKTAAALLIVLAEEVIFAAVNGMFMLSARDERGIAIVLYCFGGAQAMLTALTRTAAGQVMFNGAIFQYSAITAGTALLTAAAYFLYFSKMRVVGSA